MMRFLVILLLGIFVAACQSSLPAGTPTSAPTTAPTHIAAVATNTPQPIATATSQPTAAPTNTLPPPTATPTAVETAAPAPTAAPTATPTPATRTVYVNSDSTLNFRAEPSSTATVLRTLSPGTQLTAVGPANPPDAGGIAWQNVQTADGQSGWVAAQFLSDTQPAAAAATATPFPTPPNGTPVVTPMQPSGYVYVASPNGLNLRADKSASSQLLTTLANGQRLQTNGLGFGPDNDGITWLNVQTDGGQQGWVAAAFVTDQVPSVATPAPAVNVTDVVNEILRRTNALRQQNSLPPLVLINDLNQLALGHSQYMAQNGITHSDAGGLTPRQRITNAGYGSPYASENIFGGQASIDDAWQYWSTDPPHLQNLLTVFNTVVGIGVFKSGFMTYYTMDFGKPN